VNKELELELEGFTSSVKTRSNFVKT